MTDLGGGLGLDYNTLALAPGDPQWQTIGEQLAVQTQAALGDHIVDVQHVGSTAVPGLVAKPIIDLAVGLHRMEDLPTVDALLVEQNWIYRGDAGADGGHLFVLESTPWVRVSHAHAVLHDDAQWRRYLHFRDYLRSNAQARAAYAATKRQLLDELGPEESRRTYTERKNEIVSTLLDEAGWSSAN